MQPMSLQLSVPVPYNKDHPTIHNITTAFVINKFYLYNYVHLSSFSKAQGGYHT